MTSAPCISSGALCLCPRCLVRYSQRKIYDITFAITLEEIFLPPGGPPPPGLRRQAHALHYGQPIISKLHSWSMALRAVTRWAVRVAPFVACVVVVLRARRGIYIPTRVCEREHGGERAKGASSTGYCSTSRPHHYQSCLLCVLSLSLSLSVWMAVTVGKLAPILGRDHISTPHGPLSR